MEASRATTPVSSGLTMLGTMFDYSIWARDRLLPVIQNMEGARLREALIGGVYGSIHDTLAHMAVSEWMWIQRCQGNSPMRVPTGEDFDTLHSLVDWWNDAHAQAVEFLDTIDEAGLSIERTYMAPDGKRRTRKIWHMLLQIVNHQTEHRAQLGTMLGQAGEEVPPMDLVVYFSEKHAL